MCFSAAASFTASGVLAGTGLLTLTATNNRKLRWLASVPLVFSLQQALEGVQWLTPKPSWESTLLGYAFLFFAFLWWPVFTPLMVSLVERDKFRKRILRWLLVGGVVISGYLLAVLVLNPLQVTLYQQCILYEVFVPWQNLVAPLYVAVVCGSSLVSSRAWIRVLGLTIFLGAAVSYFFWYTTFTSVWCFFAAALSIFVYVEILRSKSKLSL